MNPGLETISLREATPADEEFLFELYASTRQEELRQVPWSTEQKEAFLRMQFTAQCRHYAAIAPQGAHRVICAGGASAGRIYFERRAESVHILDITVAPQWRNRGIGRWLLGRQMDAAGRHGLPVTIYVETFNPFLGFFERLGFQKGPEKDLRVLMKWEERSSRE